VGKLSGVLVLALVLLEGCQMPDLSDWYLFRGPSIRPWMEQTEELRDLEFVEPVQVRWIRTRDVPRITHAEMMAGLPPGYVEVYRDAYVALGVLPPGIDLLGTLLQLHQDQLVGLYSTRLRTMYVVRQPVQEARYQILVHELVHALQHQHFPRTVDMLEGLRRNDDVISSIAAVMEGDASLTMLGTSPMERRNVDSANQLSNAMKVDLDHPTGTLATVPRFLAASLIFPYAYGVVLAARSYQSSHNEGLDAMLRDPPLSTVRVYFPDDAEPVEFVRLPIDALGEPLAERGCRAGLDNVAGALTLEVLLEDHGDIADMDDLLRAWSGDRFLHVVCPSGPELLWLTRWDDAASSAQFAERYAAVAPSVAAVVGWSEPPVVEVLGRTAVVASPGAIDWIPLVLEESELRAYQSFSEWVRDDCFPESPCPEHALEASHWSHPRHSEGGGRGSRDRARRP
jgi:hypothetical protein